ncbi:MULTISPECIES: methyltransferase domain-containing protein [unclassified Streptomyces]|uniref:methyltransferase domain-containing protein n=1 Tax=unclassified Streptomyces TaxID=2593676 RepID=UPI003787EBEE
MTSEPQSDVPETREAQETIGQRFSRHAALRSEKIYGHGYQGPAGFDVFSRLAARISWVPGLRVLDVGAGLGGDAFRMADTFGAVVTGLDVSPDMTEICRQRAAAGGVAGVEFITGDVRTADLREGAYDVVWTRDFGMYLSPDDKYRVWERLVSLLRPGGQVLITDYCTGAGAVSAAFEQHVRDCGHHLLTLDGYRQVLESAKFTAVGVEDRTEELLASMRGELARLETDRPEFLTEFTEDEYRALVDRWQKKIRFSSDHELVWMVATARVPAS